MSHAGLPEVNHSSMETILELIDEGIWDWNAETGFVYRNPAWYQMLGYQAHSLDNSVLTWEKLIHPKDLATVMKLFDICIKNQSDHYQARYRCLMANGDYLWIEDKGKVISRDSQGSVKRMIGVHRDISYEIDCKKHMSQERQNLQQLIEQRTAELHQLNQELEKQVQQVEKLAITDSLTQLYNRLGFEDKLVLETERALRFNEPLSLIILDLDNFKPINDKHGHALGDRVLCHVAQVLRNNIRSFDIAARWGGDEFMLLLPNTNIRQAEHVADKLRHQLMQAPDIQPFALTASFGVTELNANEQAPQLAIRADKALYHSKRNGRNQVSSLN